MGLLLFNVCKSLGRVFCNLATFSNHFLEKEIEEICSSTKRTEFFESWSFLRDRILLNFLGISSSGELKMCYWIINKRPQVNF